MAPFLLQWQSGVAMRQNLKYLLSSPRQKKFADPGCRIVRLQMMWCGLLVFKHQGEVKMMVPSCLGNILKATKRTEVRHINSIFNKKGKSIALNHNL